MIEDTEELSKPRTEQQVGEDSVRRLARGTSDELVRIVLFDPIPCHSSVLGNARTISGMQAMLPYDREPL